MSSRLSASTLLLIALAMTGCMPFRGSDPLRIVAPAPMVTTDPDWPTVDWSLLVQRPIADQTRGSARVVVRTAGSRLSYYPGITWLDELPEMLQAEMLRAFADSDRIGAVTRPGVARGRYALASEIRRFDAVEEARGTLVVQLELKADLLEVRNGELLASRVFQTRAQVAGPGEDALTAAFEQALADLLTGLVGWTLHAPPEPDAPPPAP